MRRLVLASGVLLMACTSPGAGPAETTPAARQITYRPDTTQYLLTSHRTVEQEFQGQRNVENALLKGWIHAQLSPGMDGLAARLVLDSIVATGAAASAPGDAAAMQGSTWTGRLLPSGELVDVAGPSQAGIAAQMLSTMSQFYPRLPEAGVMAGDAWTDTLSNEVDVGGVVLTITTINRHEALGLQPWNAGEAFLVRIVSDYTLSGEGRQSGQPLTLDGSGRRHTWEYLSPDGRYVGSVVADTSSYDVVLTALGMAIPGLQWRHDTLRVIR